MLVEEPEYSTAAEQYLEQELAAAFRSALGVALPPVPEVVYRLQEGFEQSGRHSDVSTNHRSTYKLYSGP